MTAFPQRAAPGAAGVAGLDHTGVVVTDLDAAVAFFTRWLDAEVVFRLERVTDPTGRAPQRLGAPADASFALVMLALDGGRLELLQWWSDQPPSAAPPHATGAAHVAVRVADVAEAVAALASAPGVTVVSTPVTFDHGPTAGLTNAFLRTEWGVLLELVHWGGGEPVSSRPH